MQKALEQMNVQRAEVVSDLTGVTGRAIMRAILNGERDPLKLAKLRNDKCWRTEAALAWAWQGNWRDEHLFAVQPTRATVARTGRLACCYPLRGLKSKPSLLQDFVEELEQRLGSWIVGQAEVRVDLVVGGLLGAEDRDGNPRVA
jgi:hypothetical protein